MQCDKECYWYHTKWCTLYKQGWLMKCDKFQMKREIQTAWAGGLVVELKKDDGQNS